MMKIVRGLAWAVHAYLFQVQNLRERVVMVRVRVQVQVLSPQVRKLIANIRTTSAGSVDMLHILKH